MGDRIMKKAIELIQQCEELGIQLIPSGSLLKLRANQPPSEEMLTAIKDAKSSILAELKSRQNKTAECWMLEEWRRISIPDWRRILSESTQTKNANREQYARWMLREVLEDPDYQENK
jgi:hypothetical protein